MKLSTILTVPLLVASASAFAYPGNGNKDKGKGKVVEAPLDPAKAPDTIKNAQEHVDKHGASTMEGKVKDFNTPQQKDDLRKAAIGGQQQTGKVIDEEAPALWRKPNDPVSTKATSKAEGYRGSGKPADNTRSKKKQKRAVLYARMAEAKAEAEAYAEAYAETVAELDALTLHARALDEREIVDSLRRRAAKPAVYTFEERYAEPFQYSGQNVAPSVNHLFERGLMPESYNFVY